MERQQAGASVGVHVSKPAPLFWTLAGCAGSRGAGRCRRLCRSWIRRWTWHARQGRARTGKQTCRRVAPQCVSPVHPFNHPIAPVSLAHRGLGLALSGGEGQGQALAATIGWALQGWLLHGPLMPCTPMAPPAAAAAGGHGARAACAQGRAGPAGRGSQPGHERGGWVEGLCVWLAGLA